MRIARSGEPHYTAVTIPLFEDGQILFLSRQRGPLDNLSLELPRSQWTCDGQGWRKSAAADLLQSRPVARLTLLGAVMIDPMLLSLEVVVLLAEGCTAEAADFTEAGNLAAESIAVAPENLDHLIRHGEISCGVTLSALCLYRAWPREPAAAS